jgi:hypothetical protein
VGISSVDEEKTGDAVAVADKPFEASDVDAQGGRVKGSIDPFATFTV